MWIQIINKFLNQSSQNGIERYNEMNKIQVEHDVVQSVYTENVGILKKSQCNIIDSDEIHRKRGGRTAKNAKWPEELRTDETNDMRKE